MWVYANIADLRHHGIKGMKWGVRRARDHAGPSVGLTSKRQKKMSERDLEFLKSGGHLSVGLTKKRQEKFDERDKARIKKNQEKSEAQARLKDVQARMKRDKRKMNYEYRDTGGRTADGQAVMETVFKDLQGKEYTMNDLALYNRRRNQQQARAWIAIAVAGSLGGTALSELGRR